RFACILFFFLDSAPTVIYTLSYTTLFRSHHLLEAVHGLKQACRVVVVSSGMVYQMADQAIAEEAPLVPSSPYGLSKLAQDQAARSEEHTSELQSRSDLVCRLLLEKKKLAE